MGETQMPQISSQAEGEGLLLQLMPPGDPVTPEQLVEQLGLWDRPSSTPPRPRVLLNMITTADGRATLAGRSGTISGSADRALFHALRTAADGVLVGAGTVRMERYGRIIHQQERREQRERRGLPGEPPACIVSGRLLLGEDIPLLQTPEAHVVVLTSSAASLPATGARIDYIRSSGPQLDLPRALAELTERYGIANLLCEGGPHLARELLAAGLLDELFLSISPILAGGGPSAGEALRILAGMELEPPARLELLGALSAESTLFLRYRIWAL
ncbi:MAG TPA: dihydrofolate reductase family protein [Solirubrobacteraceae bacterium]